MKAGAVDFLTKPINGQRLFAAIEEALRCDASQRANQVVRDTIEQRFNQLTRREREVMLRIVCGRLNKQIAWEIGIGVKTVKVYRSRLLRKMQVRSVPHLVHLAKGLGMAMEPVPGPESQALAWKPAVAYKPASYRGHLAAGTFGSPATPISQAPGRRENLIAAPCTQWHA